MHLMKRWLLAAILVVPSLVSAGAFIPVCQRHPQMREAILRFLPASSSARSADCNQPTEADLSQIENFGGTQFLLRGPEALTASDLQGLNHLKYLSLTTYGYYEVVQPNRPLEPIHFSDDFFSETPNLVWLRINNSVADGVGNNNLGKITFSPHAFEGLSELKGLELEMASSNLSSDILEPLKSLETLSLFKLETVPDELIAKVKEGAPVRILPSELSSRGIFSKLGALKEVVASKNIKNTMSELDLAFDKHFSFVKMEVVGKKFRIGVLNSISPYASECYHEVILTKDFEIQTTEVTQSVWEKVMGKNPSEFKGANLPVETVSWDEITQKFLPKLNQLKAGQGYHYRLPTEAEWEFAARGGTSSAYFFGDVPTSIDEYAWTNRNSNSKTRAVATLKPNPFGLFDILGNVHEWVQDFYRDYPWSLETDPEGTTFIIQAIADQRMYRGGSYSSANVEDLKCGRRAKYTSSFRTPTIGFRLVRTPR